VWLYVYLLHVNNDGLWFQGDSSRHAANGLFWWDLLFRFPVHPIQFAMDYYARYPVIQPAAYPPLFYLLEGFAFSLFGASPYVAKTLVSSAAIVSGIYLIAWLRRWVAPEAGWGGLVFVLQPAVIRYSNAVMLNLPAMALALGALYHTRVWLESRDKRTHIYVATGLVFTGILTYFPNAIVIPIIFVWILAMSGWEVLRHRRLWITCGFGMLILAPLGILAKQWSPAHANAVLAPFRSGFHPEALLFYFNHLSEIVVPVISIFALMGIVLMIWHRDLHPHLKYLLLWMGICYFAFSIVSFKDARYVMLLVPALVILSVQFFFASAAGGVPHSEEIQARY
jgi:4-amino-4-deoxy-L-arabinose transferase-like glycosyltransferase